MADNKTKNPSEKIEQAKRIANKQNTNGSFDSIEETLLRIFRWLSSIIDRIIFSGKHIGVFALLLAIVSFLAVNISNSAFTTNLSSSRTLSGVSVVARYNSESFELSGLPTSCDVVLTGDAANVNNAATKSGYCLINLEGYTEGTHRVNLTASGYGDGVNAVVVPNETQIILKHKTTSQFDLGYDFTNRNSLDSKYILSSPVFEEGITKVNIRASQDTLNSISLVKALIDVTGMNEGKNDVEAPLIAYNAKGQQVNAEIVPSTVKASVNITSPKKNVPITLKVTGEAPAGLGLDTVSMDHQTTYIYASQDILDSIDEVFVNLDLSTITTDADIMQPVYLPSGVSTADITMVNIKITLAETTTKTIDNVPIIYRNNDNNLGASSVERTTVQVIATGTAQALENISANDCVVYIDLKDSEGNYLEPGEYDLPIHVERTSNVFVSFACEPNYLNITLVSQEQ